MSEATEQQPTTAQRGREETRRQKKRVIFRVADDDYTELVTAADRAGLTLGSYVRERVLAAPVTGQRRRPAVEVQAITRLQGEMNRVGGNIHQILRRVNFGETPAATEFQEALRGYREVIAAILAALRREPQ